jgi:hypothetical protein
MRHMVALFIQIWWLVSVAWAQQPAGAPSEVLPQPIQQAVDPLVRMVARPIADGWVRPGVGSAVHVRLANLGEAVQGEIVIHAEGVGFTEVTHRRRVDLPAGARRDISLPWKGPSRTTTLNIEFRAGRRSVVAPVQVRVVSDGDVLFGVIGDDAAGAQTITTTTRNGVPSRAYQESLEDPRAVRTGMLAIAGMPETSFSYQSFNGLIWLDADPTQLTPGQAEALRAFVAEGGHLWVSVTERWR